MAYKINGLRPVTIARKGMVFIFDKDALSKFVKFVIFFGYWILLILPHFWTFLPCMIQCEKISSSSWCIFDFRIEFCAQFLSQCLESLLIKVRPDVVKSYEAVGTKHDKVLQWQNLVPLVFLHFLYLLWQVLLTHGNPKGFSPQLFHSIMGIPLRGLVSIYPAICFKQKAQPSPWISVAVYYG